MRHYLTLFSLALLVPGVLPADESKAKQAFAVKLVEIVSTHSPCNLAVVRTLRGETEKDPFIVYLEVEGDHCDEAVELLNKRGRYPNFAFIPLKSGVEMQDIPLLDAPMKPKNFDLIDDVVN